MKQPPSQDKLDQFEKSLEHSIVNWQAFFRLDTDQRASAELRLLKQDIISTNPKGNYEVSPGISGIVPKSRAPRNELENLPTYFKDKTTAKSLYDFYKSMNQQASIRKL